MKWWAVLAAAVVLLILLGQLRLGCRGEYRADGCFLWLRFGGWKIQVYPRGRKEQKQQKEKQKPQKQPPKSGQENEQPLIQRVGGALVYAEELVPVLLKAAGQFKKKLCVDQLVIEVTAGAEDPGDAAMAYGRANAALGALWYGLTQTFCVEDGNARVRVDFEARETTIYGMISLSLRLRQAVWLGIYFSINALGAFLRARSKRNEKEPNRKAV